MPDVFTHIGKSGGTTLSTTLRWVYGPGACYHIPAGRPERPDRWFDETSARELEKIELVMGHAIYGAHEQIPGSCRYFTVLRHPIRRVVSLYYYIKSGWPDSAVASMSLEAFLESNHRAARPNDQVRFVSGLAPEESPSKALRRAKHNLKEEFAAFGLTERFDESLLLFREKLGWARPPVYVSSNVNRERPTVEELPSDTVDAVRSHNELDLELYRFASERFQSILENEYSEIERDMKRFDRLNHIVDVVGPPALWVYRTGRSLFRRVTP
jgi:hypothetical protein